MKKTDLKRIQSDFAHLNKLSEPTESESVNWGDFFGASARDLPGLRGTIFQYNKTGFIPGSDSPKKSCLCTRPVTCTLLHGFCEMACMLKSSRSRIPSNCLFLWVRIVSLELCSELESKSNTFAKPKLYQNCYSLTIKGQDEVYIWNSICSTMQIAFSIFKHVIFYIL